MKIFYKNRVAQLHCILCFMLADIWLASDFENAELATLSVMLVRAVRLLTPTSAHRLRLSPPRVLLRPNLRVKWL